MWLMTSLLTTMRRLKHFLWPLFVGTWFVNEQEEGRTLEVEPVSLSMTAR
jgi:hypothetical protein